MSKKTILLATVFALGVAMSPASADTLDDPLHSAVCSGAGTGCVNTDNGNFAPLGQFVNWGFTISGVHGGGPATGDLTLAILVPTNQINVSTFLLPSVTDNGGSPLAQLVGSRTTLFTSVTGASLSGYLQGLSLLEAGAFSPTDNFSNASAGQLGPPTAENPGFTGAFLAFTVTIPSILIDAQGGTTLTNDFSFGSNVPAGTTVVGFLDNPTGGQHQFVGTAASEDLVVTPTAAVPGPIAGAGLPGLVAACLTMLGLGKYRRRRKL